MALEAASSVTAATASGVVARSSPAQQVSAEQPQGNTTTPTPPAPPVTAAAAPEKRKEVTPETIEKASKNVQKLVDEIRRQAGLAGKSLEFQVAEEEEAGEISFVVKDKEGNVIRKFPPEELAELDSSLENSPKHKLEGILLNNNA
jgi:uncharacterized FlaG/YvyC family protein